MPVFLFSDAARSTLAAGISATATSVILAPGTGALFPSPTAGQQFALIFNDAATRLQFEVAYCTARTGDVLTIQRGQEGTTAQAWLIGDNAYNGPTSGTMQALLQTVHMTDASLSPIFQQMNANVGIYAPIGTGFSNHLIYGTPGTYTFVVPNNVVKGMLQLWGGGGAGGANDAVVAACGSGGAGGGYAMAVLTGLVPGSHHTLIIGAGGTCPGVTGNGTAGGNTSFDGTIVAFGGAGGVAGGNLISAGGTAVGGDINVPGGGSWPCTSFASFNAGNNFGGGGGSSPFGSVGAPGDNSAGGQGGWPGGGGSGAGDAGLTLKLGGNGAAGGAIFWY